MTAPTARPIQPPATHLAPMTPWTSVPGFIRFAVWLWAIITVVSVVIIPLGMILGFGGLLSLASYDG